MGAEIYNPQECFFFQLDAEDEQLRQLLTDDSNSSRSKGELTQLIHHAYTYGANKTVLLVGSNNTLMYCVVIKFSTTLLQSYDCIVSMMYDKYFSFLYAPELKPSTFPKEKVEMALGAHSDGEKKSDMVSWHSFITNYHLWQAINIKPDRRAIQFPLPPMDRFLPCQNAEWNLSYPRTHSHHFLTIAKKTFPFVMRKQLQSQDCYPCHVLHFIVACKY